MKTAYEMYEAYLDAELKILQGKTIIMNGRQLTYDSLSSISKIRADWEMKARLEEPDKFALKYNKSTLVGSLASFRRRWQ